MRTPTPRQLGALRHVHDRRLSCVNIKVARSLERNGWIVAEFRCSRTGLDRYHLGSAHLTDAGRAALASATVHS